MSDSVRGFNMSSSSRNWLIPGVSAHHKSCFSPGIYTGPARVRVQTFALKCKCYYTTFLYIVLSCEEQTRKNLNYGCACVERPRFSNS